MILPLNWQERACLLLGFACAGASYGAYQIEEWTDLYTLIGGVVASFLLTFLIRVFTSKERRLIAYSKELFRRR